MEKNEKQTVKDRASIFEAKNKQSDNIPKSKPLSFKVQNGMDNAPPPPSNVQKKELTPGMLARINNLEYPGNDNINVVLSRINSYFRQTIDEHLAKYYYILGKRGESYKIALENILIEWEDEYE